MSLKYMKVPFPCSISKEYLDELIVETKKNLNELNRTIYDGIKPSSGAYAFFHHVGHALARVEDIEKIVNRLFDEVHALVYLYTEESKNIPKNWPAGIPYSESVQKIMKKSDQVNGLAQLDVESLYVFGQVLLDQWSLIAVAIGNIDIKKIHPFVELVNYLEKDSNSGLKIVWDKYKTKMLWLHTTEEMWREDFDMYKS